MTSVTSGEAKRWIWQREEHRAIIDLKGKAGNTRNNAGAWMGSPLDTFEPPPF